jgi:hypothetical protein
MASVLLVEDEALIRMMIADMLVELGHTVVAEAGDFRTGLTLASAAEIDVAILDVSLGAHSSAAIAEVLQIGTSRLFSRPAMAWPGFLPTTKSAQLFASHFRLKNLSAVCMPSRPNKLPSFLA